MADPQVLESLKRARRWLLISFPVAWVALVLLWQMGLVAATAVALALWLPVGGVFCQYGPFNMNGECTSDSNLAFDQSLRESGYGGLVDIEQLQQWAGPQLKLMERIAMPANNMALVWQKIQP